LIELLRNTVWQFGEIVSTALGLSYDLGVMPELPDVTVYVERLAARTVGQELRTVRSKSPFLLRTFDPPLSSTFGKKVVGVRRIGKRIVLGLEGDLFIVIHLMIAGRLRWRPPGAAIPGKLGLASFDFPSGSVLMTEASTKKRASLHVVRGAEKLAEFSRGGIEIDGATLAQFRDALTRENHTLKRALTDPRLFSGIGNSYSDEILHAARLSPVKRTAQMTDEEVARLFEATRRTLDDWTDRLRKEVGDEFPEKVTAFRDGMAVHGRYGKPCPVCGSPVQRIVYAENETNYCARCQTGGKLLADRALSRLLHEDWPRTLEEMEELKDSRS
jgi:formamidopyrimidine-DNA glycosylase